jgi:5-methylthioadenosine/S-adenosylhomocysteine deaminase
MTGERHQKTLIRGATVLAMDDAHGAEPFVADILIEDDRITQIGPELGDVADAELIDAAGKLVMPGLVNGHLHSSEQFFKGRYERMPLEIWLLYAYPLLMGPQIPERLLYLRSLVVAMESLKNGVTTICDCFFDPPVLSLERLGTVFSAYDNAGVRANVANSIINIPVLDTLPYARDVFPPDLQAVLDKGTMITGEAYADYCEQAFAAFDGRAGRLRYMVSPSAPQRCTPDLLEACADLARRHRVPFHTHVLETKTQAVTGAELFGKSLIRAMHDLGILFRNVTFAHAVWVSDDDMALMGEAGLSVVHNAISNQKLGAGVAPLRRLLDAGVTVGLGTDGASSNDTLRIFDVVRVAALIHGVSGPDYAQWLSADDIIRAATIDGARSAMLEHDTGSLEIGKRADLIVLRTDGLDYTPLNDIRKHLVYCENGGSIELVMVDGEVVCRDGRLTLIDEEAILAEVRETVPAWLAEHALLEQRNAVFEPHFAEIHRRATLQDIGTNRYAGDAPLWPGSNRATPAQ